MSWIIRSRWNVSAVVGLAILLPSLALADISEQQSTVAQGPILIAQTQRTKKRQRRPAPTPKAVPRTAVPETPPAAPPADAAQDAQGLARGARVEFDGRLVQGQTARGALLLLARKRSELRSMVEERLSYRREILRTVYPEYDGPVGEGVAR